MLWNPKSWVWAAEGCPQLPLQKYQATAEMVEVTNPVQPQPAKAPPRRRLIGDPLPRCWKFQDFMTETKAMIPKAQQTKYATAFSETLAKNAGKLQKALDMLELVTCGGKYKGNAIPALVKSMDALEAEHEEMDGFASKFGLVAESKKWRRGKK